MTAGEGSARPPIRVALPYHLRTLANIQEPEVLVEVDAPVTAGRILDALEARYPMLAGTIREHGTGKRRAFMRFLRVKRTGRMSRWMRSFRRRWRLDGSR